MPDEEEIKQDPQGQSSDTTDPSKNQDGQSTKDTIQAAQDELPEKFKGKTAAEIAKAHIELEKKLGEQSNEVNQTRQNLANWEALGKVIQGNPALEKLIIEEIAKIKDGQATTDNKEEKPVVRTEERVAIESDIVQKFEAEVGLDRLSKEDQEVLRRNIGKELEDMLDPRGDKQASQLVNEIPLNKLPIMLRKAYKLATADDEKERARVKGLLQARENREGEFGSIPSSSSPSLQRMNLSEDEKKVARKLHITEEQYWKNKQDLAR